MLEKNMDSDLGASYVGSGPWTHHQRFQCPAALQPGHLLHSRFSEAQELEWV